MKRTKRILMVLVLTAFLLSVLCIPAFAVTEADVEAQVAASGKEAVAGNLLIWFLCAVAFLKVSQKVDSFMATLGVNVGRTGGSLLAEAMIAMRAVTMVIGGKGSTAGRAGSASGASSSAGGASTSGMAGFFKGGLIGMAGRRITNSAVKTATTQTSAVHTAQRQAAASAAAQTVSGVPDNHEVQLGGSSVHTEKSAAADMPPQAGVIVSDEGVSFGDEAVNPSSDAPPQTVPPDYTPPVTPGSTGAIPQADVIHTESGPMPSMSQPNPTQQAADAQAGSVPIDPAPPQESVPIGTAFTPDSISSDAAPPNDSAPIDMRPSQEGVIVTGGDTSIHAPHTGDNVSVSSAGYAPPAGKESEKHTHASSEKVQTLHTVASSEKVQASRSFIRGGTVPTLGGMVFSHSLAAGGSFANEVIGMVARGDVAGSITGNMAAQALHSYMGYTAKDSEAARQTSFRNVEIGRGRITGVEFSPAHPEGIAFSMYHVGQYTTPEGDYQRGVTADGQAWYRQYAVDTVQKTPFEAPDGTIAYDERIVKRVPKPPARKDRI